MVELMWQWWLTFQTKREAGQGLVEYALILVLISVVAIAIMSTLGTTISSVFSAANNALTP
jgi:pilus assembly protein Flp/PilA